MIIFKKKEFSTKSKDLVDVESIIEFDSIGFGRELLKLIIIENINQDIQHWLTVAVDDYIKNIRLGIQDNISSNVKFPIVLSPCFDKKKLGKWSDNKIIKTNYELDYLRDCIKAIQTDTSYGKVKYNHLKEIKNLWPTEDLLISFKFIALCLTGQINPKELIENGESWKYYDLAKRTEPNFAKECSSDLQEIKQILRLAVRIIRENTGKSYEI